MLLLRRIAARPHWLYNSVRGTATIQESAGQTSAFPPSLLTPSSSSNVPQLPQNTVKSAERTPKPIPTKGRKKRKGIVTKRPNISLDHPRRWNRPIREGVLPAYDEALKLLLEDSQAIKAEMHVLEDRVNALKAKPEGEGDEGLLSELTERLGMLAIQSEINLPDVRWKFANGMADMTKPIYRHLAEKRWRSDGALDLLMERIHQMNVVPDLVSSLHPSFDLRITFPEAPPQSLYLRTRTKRRYKDVEPGIFLLPEQTRRPPRLYTTVFHTDTRYYTMILVDPDVPDPEENGFTAYLHWLQPNIPLSSTSISPIPAYPQTRYIPPHPQRGSPYHRYTILFLPNPNPTEKLPIPVVDEAGRRGFDLRKFCEKYGFDASKGGAAHMWREVWDETVSQIYKETLKLPEPKYGLPPKVDPYADLKRTKRYTT